MNNPKYISNQNMINQVNQPNNRMINPKYISNQNMINNMNFNFNGGNQNFNNQQLN